MSIVWGHCIRVTEKGKSLFWYSQSWWVDVAVRVAPAVVARGWVGHNQEAKGWMLHPVGFLLLFFSIQSGISVHRRVSSKFMVGFPSFVKPLWKHTHKYSQRCVDFLMTPGTVKLTMKLTTTCTIWYFICVYITIWSNQHKRTLHFMALKNKFCLCENLLWCFPICVLLANCYKWGR